MILVGRPSRRAFLALAGTAAAAVPCRAYPDFLPRDKAMRLGGPVFVKSDDPAVSLKPIAILGIALRMLRAIFL